VTRHVPAPPLGRWDVAIDSSAPEYGGPGSPVPTCSPHADGDMAVTVPPRSAVLWQPDDR
jgi:hypothetical protein